MNEQAIEGISGALTVDVVHIWPTIQGEGPFAGTPAVFVRLAGCNLRCPACDTDYTSQRREMSVGEVVAAVQAHRQTGLVVITGGEPFRQNSLPVLSNSLETAGFRVQIETNGLLFQPLGRQVAIICSPKTAKVHPLLAERIMAYKYVVQDGFVDPEDGLPTSVLGTVCRVARPRSGAEVFVQPLDEGDADRNHRNTQAAVRACMEHGYRLCLQLHKIVGLE